MIGFDQLQLEADQQKSGVPIAVAGGADRTVLEAVRTATDRGWIRPLVIGNKAQIRQVAEECGEDWQKLSIIDSQEPAERAVAEVRSGRAKMIMKGQIATPALMRAVLNPVAGLRSARVICQIVMMEIFPVQRRYLLADTGICIQPTLDQKIDILKRAVALAQALGTAIPKVALLAATESVVETMPETLEAAEICRLHQAAALAPCLVHGPLSFDLAYAVQAGAKKQIQSPVVGAADILLFPNLLAANLTVKAIMYTANCSFGGILVGAACPVAFMSRADSTSTRLNSLALALKWVTHSDIQSYGYDKAESYYPKGK
ncbi:MAG TPA: phosphate acyltransferase [Gemmataceae bacterium]|jgi:phosphotransacetylase|nr:phosphate acyltransferase [Gemmataceae bacterium]